MVSYACTIKWREDNATWLHAIQWQYGKTALWNEVRNKVHAAGINLFTDSRQMDLTEDKTTILSSQHFLIFCWRFQYMFKIVVKYLAINWFKSDRMSWIYNVFLVFYREFFSFLSKSSFVYNCGLISSYRFCNIQKQRMGFFSYLFSEFSLNKLSKVKTIII